MAWDGLRVAWRTDPDGVAAVLRAVRDLPQHPDRHAAEPPLWVEVARLIEVESTWNPAARNPVSGATGLIQWMPKFAPKSAGYTVEEIRAMSRAQQAPLVRRYLNAVATKVKPFRRVGDVYVAGAYPVAVAWEDARVIAEPGSPIWVQNPAWRDPQAGGGVTVRRLRELGTPEPLPSDLRAEIEAALAATTATSASAPPASSPPPPLSPPTPTTSSNTTPTVSSTSPAASPPSVRGAGEGAGVGALVLILILALATARSKGCLP